LKKANQEYKDIFTSCIYSLKQQYYANRYIWPLLCPLSK